MLPVDELMRQGMETQVGAVGACTLAYSSRAHAQQLLPVSSLIRQGVETKVTLAWKRGGKGEGRRKGGQVHRLPSATSCRRVAGRGGGTGLASHPAVGGLSCIAVCE